jgi:3-isopropylmalate/(R)-2-methylmalate dehydratase small subunit
LLERGRSPVHRGENLFPHFLQECSQHRPAVVECDTDAIDEGDILEYDVGSDVLKNRSKNLELAVTPLPEIMVEILKEGGVVPYIKKHGGF